MAALTIGIDVTPTINGATGIARYVRELGRALDGLDDAPVRKPFAVGRAQVPPEPGVRRCRVPLRLLQRSWARGGPPSVERLVGPLDTVHASGPALPTAAAPVVAVVYDLAPLDHPELHPARAVAQLRRYVEGLHRAAAVVAISQATADRLSAEAPRVPIHVTPLGSPRLPAAVSPARTGGRYVLAVGMPVARKGYERLVDALPHLDPEVRLVVVGAPGPIDRALRRRAGELGVADRLHRATSVSDAELAGWYSEASAVAVPSTEEGFSLPLVEAQRYGAPLVVSDIPVHREVAAGSALLVPPGDVRGWVDALTAVLAGGAEIERLVQAGQANATRYTWERCAAATLAVHRGIAG